MINNLTIGDISIDCANPERTRDFYSALFCWKNVRHVVAPHLLATTVYLCCL